MNAIKRSKVAYLLWSLLSGTISFFIGGFIVCLILLRLDTYILETIIAGGLAGLLLGILLGTPKMIGKITLAGLVAVPVGFWASFILAEAIFSTPFIHGFFENPNTPDVIGITLMGILCGIIFGSIVYGRKSIPLFSAVCGISAIPFALLVAAMNSGHWIKTWLIKLHYVMSIIDLNLLVMITAFGLGIGLSIGLNNMLKPSSDDRSSL